MIDQELLGVSFDESFWTSCFLKIDIQLGNAISQEEIDKLTARKKAARKEWKFARLVREKDYYDNTPEAETPSFFKGADKIGWENSLKKRMGLDAIEHQQLISDILDDLQSGFNRTVDEQTNGLKGIR
jgi:hypothetical protein